MFTLHTFLRDFCPFVNFKCWLITATFCDGFSKLSTNIKHDQMKFRNKNHNLVYIFYRIMPHCNFHFENGVLFKTVKAVLMKLGTNIKYYEMICREQ